MSSKNRIKKANSAVIPVRMPEDMQKQIRTLSDRARLSAADIMRLAIERGMAAVEKMFSFPS